MIEPTDRHLKIPAALARKYGRADDLLIDDLESAGTVALVEGLRSYDPARGASLDTHLYNCVKWACQKRLTELRAVMRGGRETVLSLDAAPPSGEGSLAEAVGAEDDPSRWLESEELAEEVRRRCRPREWAVLLLRHKEGLTLEAIGERLGVVREAVRQVEAKCLERLRRSSLTFGRSDEADPVGTARFPVGTVRVMRKSRGNPKRWVKVREDGPKGRRWQPLARVLWERAHGPVPRGKRVGHLDGDVMNDDLSNLALFGPSDAAGVWADRASEAEREAAEARRIRASAKANRGWAAARHALGVLALERWYLVDDEGRVITGPHGKVMGCAYRAAGFRVPESKGRCPAWAPTLLGWPELTAQSACVLAVLVEGGRGMTRGELEAPARALCARHNVPAAEGWLGSALYPLRKAGLARTTRRGALGQALHEATPRALETRGPVCRLRALQGRDCQALKDAGYDVLPPRKEFLEP